MFEDGTQIERAAPRYVPGTFLAEPKGGCRENGCHRETLHDPDGDGFRLGLAVLVFRTERQLKIGQFFRRERVGGVGPHRFAGERPHEGRSVAVGDRGGDRGFTADLHLHHLVVADGERDHRGLQPVDLDAQLLRGRSVRVLDAEREVVDTRFPGLEREGRAGTGRFVVEEPCVDGAFGVPDRRGDRHRFAHFYRVDAFGIVQRDDGFGPAVGDYAVLVAGCEQRQKERRR